MSEAANLVFQCIFSVKHKSFHVSIAKLQSLFKVFDDIPNVLLKSICQWKFKALECFEIRVSLEKYIF